MVGRGGHLLGRAAALGRARGPGGRGRARFAFLPVAYSRVAVTDVGALMGVALALLWSVRAAEDGRTARLRAGRRRGRAGDRVQVHGRAGAAAARRSRRWRALRADGARALGGAGARRRRLAALVFVVLNPYLFGSLDDWWSDLRDQADVAANDPKPGQESGGLSYYLDSLTWGLGWAGLAAALRRRRAGAAPRPGARPDAGRAAAGAVRLPGRCSRATSGAGCCPPTRRWRCWPRWRVRAALAEPAAPAGRARRALPLAGAGARRSRARARPAAGRRRAHARSCWAARTRSARRATGSSRRYPPELRVSIEPAVPGRYFRSNPDGPHARLAGALPAPRRLDRARLVLRRRRAAGGCARSTSRACSRGPTAACGPRPTTPCSRPGVIDDYRLYGYCLVMTVERGARARARDRRPATRAPTTSASSASRRWCASSAPTTTAPSRCPFSFDLSYNYYPPRLRAAGADGAHLPAARLPAGLRAAADPDPEGARAGAVLARAS